MRIAPWLAELSERFSSCVGIYTYRHEWRAENSAFDMGDIVMNEQNDNQVRELSKDEMEQVQGGLLVDNIRGWTYQGTCNPRDRDVLQLDSSGGVAGPP